MAVIITIYALILCQKRAIRCYCSPVIHPFNCDHEGSPSHEKKSSTCCPFPLLHQGKQTQPVTSPCTSFLWCHTEIASKMAQLVLDAERGSRSATPSWGEPAAQVRETKNALPSTCRRRECFISHLCGQASSTTAIKWRNNYQTHWKRTSVCLCWVALPFPRSSYVIKAFILHGYHCDERPKEKMQQQTPLRKEKQSKMWRVTTAEDRSTAIILEHVWLRLKTSYFCSLNVSMRFSKSQPCR